MIFRKTIKSLKVRAKNDHHALDADVLYPCYGLQIHLPRAHKLPAYQRRHQNYDKFLPHLAKFISPNGTIIDIGANCGYIFTGMAQQNPHARYICIEPDGLFNSCLRSNVDMVRSTHPGIEVTILSDLVGKGIKNAMLKNSGGTSVAVPNEGNMMTRTLDDIMQELPGADVRLLKSDVDGFDYDVLDSARQLIDDQHPAIYFECQHDHEYQRRGFETTMTWLADQGYVRWSAFDNFGELMITATDPQPIFSLMGYVMKQNEGRATRTIYYLDILCVCSKDLDLMSSALKAY